MVVDSEENLLEVKSENQSKIRSEGLKSVRRTSRIKSCGSLEHSFSFFTIAGAETREVSLGILR